MEFWLVKTEPDVYSIDDLKKDGSTEWHGVRNYQARNYLKTMKKGDVVFIYHSNADEVGIAGQAAVHMEARPDRTQFDKKSEYFDSKASNEKPIWFCPKLKFIRKFSKIIPLSLLRQQKALQQMKLLQKGSRLSVLPISAEEHRIILNLLAN
jgi:predicted RNA-binding protein with PUA-like domain